MNGLLVLRGVFVLVFLLVVEMGCGGSKVDDTHIVSLCRERKQLIRAAADHRYELAAAHVLYFQSLTTVGEALRKFVEEELVIGANSTSSLGSPVLTFPSDDRKLSKSSDKVKNSYTSASISHSGSHNAGGDIDGSHLHLSSESDSGSELSSHSGHIHIQDSPVSRGPSPFPDPDPSTSYGVNYSYPYSNPYPYPYPYPNPNPYPYPYSYPPGEWGMEEAVQPRAYYMKKSSTPMKSVIFEEPERHSVRKNDGWAGYRNPVYEQYGAGGYFGYPEMGPPGNGFVSRTMQQEQPPPAPPSPPNVSAWDYFNVFQTYDDVYPGYYTKSGYGLGSATSSPDSNEVREREGIPDLEDETEIEMVKAVNEEKKKPSIAMASKNLGEDHSRTVPWRKNERASKVPASQQSEASSKVLSRKNERAPKVPPSQQSEASSKVPSVGSDSTHFTINKDISASSPETIKLKGSSPGGYTRKGVSFEVEAPVLDIGSQDPSSLTSLSARGTRDLEDVVSEIKHEFETASGYGKEVAVLLEVGKLPYRSKDTTLKAIFSRVMYLVAPSTSSSATLNRPTMRVSSRTMKMAKAYFADAGRELGIKSGNISTTLEKLYFLERKLYKEIKDEEKLRAVYEKKCKKLKHLDDRGAESTKIDAAQATIRSLHTRIDVCIRAVDVISSRIHKLRDEELRPQLTELIRGLIRMWKSMFKCHQKQLGAIMESKARSLKANIGSQREPSLRATAELEVELGKWRSYFNQWVDAQKSYVESLNGWLLRCLNQEPEETADGVAPFSPSRAGAPPIFVICNDWCEAMENISQERVSNAMGSFALQLHQLWERQDEEHKQRVKAEFISKDFEKQLRNLRMEQGRLEDYQAKLTAEGGVSRLDDLKVDLDSMKKKLEVERARHKETMHLVHDAASTSLQSGLLPIFETLENFTSEVLKGYLQIRLDS
ncbi:hypothetical protein SAY87_014251 [Trapa incisa]|uniref:Uncharacterized protein n=1 Tax=Trapa incisa TaxID=236973 RepID=A0AAN7GJT0_9MYRT|nr:hypothetical protein SAY87_014251 [Trapa incisa]